MWNECHGTASSSDAVPTSFAKEAECSNPALYGTPTPNSPSSSISRPPRSPPPIPSRVHPSLPTHHNHSVEAAVPTTGQAQPIVVSLEAMFAGEVKPARPARSEYSGQCGFFPKASKHNCREKKARKPYSLAGRPRHRGKYKCRRSGALSQIAASLDAELAGGVEPYKRKPYSLAGRPRQRGEYKCGQCGFFPKALKHNCREETAKRLTPELAMEHQQESAKHDALRPQQLQQQQQAGPRMQVKEEETEPCTSVLPHTIMIRQKQNASFEEKAVLLCTIACCTTAIAVGGNGFCGKHGGGAVVQEDSRRQTDAKSGQVYHADHATRTLNRKSLAPSSTTPGTHTAAPIARGLCSTQNCTRKIIAKGVCGQHNERGDAAAASLAANRKVCLAAGCNNNARVRGVCNKHNVRDGTKLLCSFRGCTTTAVARGICHKHGGKGDSLPIVVARVRT